MKVLITVDDMKQELGGVSSSIAVLYRNLLNKNIDIKVGVSKSSCSKGYSNFEMNQIRLYCASQLIKNDQLDIVHNNGIWTGFSYATMKSSFRKNIKTVQSIHGMLEPWSLSQGNFKKQMALFFYQKGILESADLLHASTLEEVRAIRTLGIKNKIAVIPNGIDIHSKLELKKNKPYKLLFLSRIHKKKGIELLLEAISRYRYRFELVIAGNGELNYINKLKEEVKDFGLENSVSFAGYVTGKEKEDLFVSSDFFVLPTYSENFGNVVAESLRYGKPVITTDTTPWNDIKIQECGYITKPTVESIIGALKSVSELSLDKYIDMQKKAFQLGKKYDIDSVGEQYLMMYRYLSGSSNIPDFIDI